MEDLKFEKKMRIWQDALIGICFFCNKKRRVYKIKTTTDVKINLCKKCTKAILDFILMNDGLDKKIRKAVGKK